MASLSAACRASARLVGSRATAARGFTTSARCLAAQNFVMPALSPTMTEGNIATWKVKEGENYSAGDVLLEIETDKATMDVEAQEDGIMVKIMAQDGAKGVQVGSRIAVLAEVGDDIKTLEIPADEQKASSSSSSSDSVPKEDRHSTPAKDSETKKTAPALSNEVHEQKYPLMPSVESLVKQNGISEDVVGKIKPTGPGGRLLKGDVLAYLGTIDADRPAANSSMFEKLSHLDLSNIKVAEKKATPPTTAAKGTEAPVEPAQPKTLEVNVPVSLAKVVEVQQRIQDTLGVFMPMSTFISRAAEVANEDLPPAKRQPTASELFDQVLGLDKIKTSSRGNYLPQISAIPPSSLVDSAPAKRRAASKSNDIIDILAAKPSKKAAAEPSITTVPGLSNGLNVFSLTVPKEEEQRAYMFLAQCKVILEEEPGRLVL